jgi:hypothetical protein
MKRICKGLIVMALILLITPLAEAQFTGHELVEGWKVYQRMLAGQAVAEKTDAFRWGHYLGFVTGIAHAVSYYYGGIPSGSTVNQECNIVGKYLDEHPERWHEEPAILVIDALAQAFPTFPKKSK